MSYSYLQERAGRNESFTYEVLPFLNIFTGIEIPNTTDHLHKKDHKVKISPENSNYLWSIMVDVHVTINMYAIILYCGLHGLECCKWHWSLWFRLLINMERMMHMNVRIYQDYVWKQRVVTNLKWQMLDWSLFGGLLQWAYWSSMHCINKQEKLIEISITLLCLNYDGVDVLEHTLWTICAFCCGWE